MSRRPTSSDLPLTFEEALQAVRRDLRARQRRISVAAIAWLLALFAFLFSLVSVFHGNAEGPAGMLIALAFVLIALWATPSEPSQVVNILGTLKDPRSVGPLLKLMEETEYYQEAMKPTLIRLLARMSPEQTAALDDGARARLIRVMSLCDVTQDTCLLTATLQALEQMGDARAMPYVERWAEGPVWSPEEGEVRQAARRCLDWLREREKQAKQSGTLLRPASSLTSAEDSLLRPATGAPADDATRLLRPIEGESEDSGG